MPNFTPGPWRWCGYYLLQDCIASETGFPDANGKETNPFNTPAGNYIIEDGSAGGEYTGIDTSSPDALLIAAAPDLYAVAQRIVEWMDTNGYGPEDQSFGARAALAKADGEEKLKGRVA